MQRFVSHCNDEQKHPLEKGRVVVINMRNKKLKNNSTSY